MNFKSDRHSLYVGWVIGQIVRSNINAEPICDDEGNYTSQIRMRLSEISFILTIPEPPEEWSPT